MKSSFISLFIIVYKYLIKELIYSIRIKYSILCFCILLITINAAAQTSPDFIQIDSYSSAVSSVSVQTPSGFNAGDLMMVYIVTDDDGAITNPSEFSELYDFEHDTNGPLTGLFYRILDGSESASYAFGFPSEPAIVTTLIFKNVDGVNPFIVHASLSGDSNTPATPSVTTTKDNLTILHFIGVDGASGGVLNFTSPTANLVAAAESGTAGGNAEMMIVSELQSTAGATTPGSFTFSTDEWTGITVALNIYSINNNNITGASCAVGSASFEVDYDLPGTSGILELVDPSGSVLTTQNYTSSIGTASLSFTPTSTGAYMIRDQSSPTISTSAFFFIDTDGDSYCDDVDADDDNDGILDIIESPTCFNLVTGYETGDRSSLITVTTGFPFTDGNPQQLVDGNTASTGNGIRKTNGNHSFTSAPGSLWQFQLTQPIKYTSFSLFTEGAIYLDSDVSGTIQGSNDGVTWIDLTVAGGLLMDDPNTVYTIELTQNISQYTYYRMFCTDGQVDDDEWLSEVTGTTEIVGPASLATTPCGDVGIIPAYLNKDTDGDGCFDALEGSQNIASASVDANGRLTGNVDGNGVPTLVNNGQGIGESIDGGYLDFDCPCMDPNKLTNNCDFDGDSYPNAIDEDDDNDGILDIAECGDFAFLDAPGGSTTHSLTVCYNVETNGIGGNTMTFMDDKLLNTANFGPSGTYKVMLNLVEVPAAEITVQNLIAKGCQVYQVGGNTASGTDENALTSEQKRELGEWSHLSPANIVFAFQGMITAWTDHYGVNGTTNPTVGTSTGRGIFNGPFGSVSGFNQAGSYRGTYVPGSTPYCAIAQDANGAIVGLVDELSQDFFLADFGLLSETGDLTNSANITSSSDKMLGNIYAFFAQFILEGKTNMCRYLQECLDDTDGDTFPNVVDYDSDDDGCFDAFEGSLTIAGTSVDVNGQLTGNVTITGVPEIIGAGQDIGFSQNDGCLDDDCPCTDPTKQAGNCDFDSDSYNNNVDKDDDNDGIPDDLECGPFIFLAEPGGSASNTVSVCYNPNNYGIGGSQMTFADDKLTNLANFGPSGTFKATLNLVSIDPSNVTKANLNAQGCNIFQVSGNNNDSGSGTSLAALNQAQKEALLEWSVASPSNVVFGFQGLITTWTDHIGVQGTSNPTSNTSDGRAIFNGPFGTVTQFNQGGGYQGYIQLGTSKSCVIMQDNNGNPVGIVDFATQDIFIADFDLFSELGSLTNNAGISSASDIMLGNIYAFMAQYVLEAETNMCNYLSACTQDTDTDMIIDVFDKDSDGDDCLDALEGDGLFTSDQLVDGMLMGNVSSEGIPELAGPTGQLVGQSQNALLMGACAFDLKLTVDNPSVTANKGEQIEFVYTLTNESSITVDDVNVRILIPSNSEFVAALASKGSYSNLTKVWDIGTATAGTDQTLKVTIQIK